LYSAQNIAGIHQLTRNSVMDSYKIYAIEQCRRFFRSPGDGAFSCDNSIQHTTQL